MTINELIAKAETEANSNTGFSINATLKEWEVIFPTDSFVGSFENTKNGAGGELLIDEDFNLLDYDGLFELPKPVIEILRIHNITVDQDFE